MSVASRTPSGIGSITLRSTMAIDWSSFSISIRRCLSAALSPDCCCACGSAAVATSAMSEPAARWRVMRLMRRSYVFEVEAHDRPRRHVADEGLEAEPFEGRGEPRAGCARRQRGVERIRFDRRRPGTLRGPDRAVDQGCANTAPSVTLPNIETGDRPHRHLVDASEPPGAIDDRQIRARRQLTPSDRDVAVEGEEAGRRTAPHDPPEVRLVAARRAAPVAGADPPVHAPAAAARAARTEEVLERGPEIRRERFDGQLQR